MNWDVFISHASEDKKGFVKDLANILTSAGVKVWYDEFSIKTGDSISKMLDAGLSNSNFGVLVFSPFFITKGWTDYELRSLLNREVGYKKIILPVWHNISKEEVQTFSPFLADKFALNTGLNSVEEIAHKLMEIIRPDIYENLQRHLQYQEMLKKAKKGVSKDYDLFKSIKFHESLPIGILNRIKLFHKIVGQVSGIDLQKTIENFKGDMNPEREIRIWEAIAVTYSEIITTFKIKGSDHQEEIFKIILGYSMGIAPTNTRLASDDALFKILEVFKQHFPGGEK